MKPDPELPAILSDEGPITHGRLGGLADVVARELIENVTAPGGVVAFRADYSGATLVLLHAIWRSGRVAAPLHPELTAFEFADARAALESCTTVDVTEVARFTKLRARGGAGGSEAPGPAGAHAITERAPGDVAAIIWTSGSAGAARGVQLTWGGFHQISSASARRMALGPTDRWLLSLTPASMGGLALVARAALTGAAVVVEGAFHASTSVRAMEQGRFTHASLVPTQLQRILDERGARPAPPGLRGILLGGAALPVPLMLRALDLGYPIYPTYGMTETTSQVATADPETARAWPGTVGTPLDGVQVAVGDDGQILVRGPTVSPGTLAGPLPTVDGWFQTGDLGEVDSGGRLFVLGRLNDRIITGGATVDPLAVERAAEDHPEVERACVIGLSDPDWGERLVAVLVPKVGATLDSESILGHLRERLRPALRPRELFLWASPLPTARSGKIDRAAVRRAVEDGAAGLTRLSDG